MSASSNTMDGAQGTTTQNENKFMGNITNPFENLVNPADKTETIGLIKPPAPPVATGLSNSHGGLPKPPASTIAPTPKKSTGALSSKLNTPSASIKKSAFPSTVAAGSTTNEAKSTPSVKTTASYASKSAAASSTPRTPRSTIRTTSAPSSSKRQASTFSPTPSAASSASRSSGGGSANKNTSATRAARQKDEEDRRKRVELLKTRWAKEREEKQMKHKDKRSKELQELQESSDRAAALRRQEMENERKFKEAEKERLRELLSNSIEVRNESARIQEQQELQRRRMSIALNQEVRQRAKIMEERQKLKEQEERIQDGILKADDYQQIKAAKRAEEEQRRMSLQFRAQEVKRQKETVDSLQQRYEKEQQKLLEVRQSNWYDEQKAKMEAQRRRRMSVADRLQEWRGQKVVSAEIEDQKKEAVQLELMLRHEDFKNRETFKQEQIQRDRDSLAFRLQKWRESKFTPDYTEQREREAAEIARDLRKREAAALKAYEAAKKKAERQSLLFRMDEARRQKTWEQGKKAFEAELREEERRIQKEERQDVSNYHKKIREDRRASLQYRNQCATQERMRLEGFATQQSMQDAADFQARKEDWEAVKEAQIKQREQERQSIAFRLAEAHRIKQLELQEHHQQLDVLHVELEVRKLDADEQREFRKIEQERSRRSIALRLASWKETQLQEEREKEENKITAQEEALLREQDREDLLAAKLAYEMMEKHHMLEANRDRMCY